MCIFPRSHLPAQDFLRPASRGHLSHAKPSRVPGRLLRSWSLSAGTTPVPGSCFLPRAPRCSQGSHGRTAVVPLHKRAPCPCHFPQSIQDCSPASCDAPATSRAPFRHLLPLHQSTSAFPQEREDMLSCTAALIEAGIRFSS